MNKKNWFDWSNDCCQKSNTMYDKEIQNDENDFDIIEEMNAQNFTEIYLNYRVFPGAWIVLAGLLLICDKINNIFKMIKAFNDNVKVPKQCCISVQKRQRKNV